VPQVVLPMKALEFLIDNNPPGRTMVLAPTQPLTEMSTRDISWEQRWSVHTA